MRASQQLRGDRDYARELVRPCPEASSGIVVEGFPEGIAHRQSRLGGDEAGGGEVVGGVVEDVPVPGAQKHLLHLRGFPYHAVAHVHVGVELAGEQAGDAVGGAPQVEDTAVHAGTVDQFLQHQDGRQRRAPPEAQGPEEGGDILVGPYVDLSSPPHL